MKRAPRGTKRKATEGLVVRLSFVISDGRVQDRTEVELAAPIAQREGATGGVPASDLQGAARRIARGTHGGRLAQSLAAIAHAQRIRLLLKLLGGEATYRLLGKTTGLKAGPLYHHLNELRAAGFIGPKVRDIYSLTNKGRRAILASLALGRVLR